ncbi:hypothetical protein [Sulfurimonas diazotrophicus]|uniref:ABC transporter ATP-binding protein n=1 Tax=Sulfurimonas diazotrophicus TaxID=3131939 RepID=A0ABZ3HEF2_9BACT
MNAEEEKKDSKLTRKCYMQMKNAYENSTVWALAKKVPGLTKWTVIYFISLIASVAFPIISAEFIDESWIYILSLIIFTMLFLAWMIWIIYGKSIMLLEKYYHNSKKIKKYRKYWLGSRYEYFRESLTPNDKCDFDGVLALLQEERKRVYPSFWDHKLFATNLAFLMVGWSAIAGMLANGDVISKALLVYIVFVSITILPLIGMLVITLQTKDKEFDELEKFIFWYECEKG